MDLGATDVILCLSQGSTFRHDLYRPYKAKRGRKPVGTKALKEWLIAEHGARVKPGIEADDQLGILATHPSLVKGEKIIVSADKDLQTIPGLLYRGGEEIEVSEEEADRFWLYQTLTGDTTDGYPGCPGVGPKKAEAILNCAPADRWAAVVEAFDKAGLPAEEAILQARLARILRHTDYDFKRKEVRLWTPDS